MARTRRATSSRSPTTSKRRASRSRPTPRWLTGRTDLDQVAQRRCLMLLSVLSGEKPVTLAIEELGISRGFYYQLETKALVAMLAAVAPGADGAATPDGASTTRRLSELEAKVTRLEQDKRRLERLLYLARKVLPAGPVTTGRGRPRKTVPRSTSAGRRRSPSSPRTTRKPAATSSAAPGAPSTPTTDGETTR
jgi:hypothetical protein